LHGAAHPISATLATRRCRRGRRRLFRQRPPAVYVSSSRVRRAALAFPIMSLCAATGASACSSARTTTRFIAISWQANAASTVWRSLAYCLIPNHVHLILVPEREEALGRALGERHRRYWSTINARLTVTGHLFQARIAACEGGEAVKERSGAERVPDRFGGPQRRGHQGAARP